MKIYNNYPIKQISWNGSGGGQILNYYLPETYAELVELLKVMIARKNSFEVVGYTSNLLFTATYAPEHLIGTRLVNQYEILDDTIICDCGVSVSKLSRDMVELGVEGFEGLIDLPGTIASAVYGNASCYNCSISSMLISIELLTCTGEVIRVSADALDFQTRSSALKRGTMNGIILKVFLRKRMGDLATIKKKSEYYRDNRKKTQPGPSKNLGSIFIPGRPTILFHVTRILGRIYMLFCRESDQRLLILKRQQFVLKCLGYGDVAPYLEWGLNRYIWKDSDSYVLFFKYIKLYRKLFKNSRLEIEIKR